MDQVSQQNCLKIKRCSKCKNSKSASEFFRSKRSRDGRQGWCKSCIAIKREATDHHVSVVNKICRLCKTDKSADAYYRNRLAPDGLAYECKICARDSQRPHKATAKARDYARRYRRTFGRYNTAKAQAKRKGVEFNLNEDEFNVLVASNCEYCVLPITTANIGLDRLNNDLGYIISNVVPCCAECNIARNDKFTPDEMRVHIGPAIRSVKLARDQHV